eukprot:gene339-363_t
MSYSSESEDPLISSSSGESALSSSSSTAATLFVGDLSIFCSEEHLRLVFGQYGVIEEVKIIRCENTHKNLCYGFVRLVEGQAAASAMTELNGKLLCGRPLRIRWAAHKPSQQQELSPSSTSTTCPTEQDKDEEKAPTASIHVVYSSNYVVDIITEERLHPIFSQHGIVIDTIIKRYEIDEVNGWQRGYAFIHYDATPSGVQSALSCVHSMNDVVIDNIHFKCSVSHKLEALLKDRHLPSDYPPPPPTGAWPWGIPLYSPVGIPPMMVTSTTTQGIERTGMMNQHGLFFQPTYGVPPNNWQPIDLNLAQSVYQPDTPPGVCPLIFSPYPAYFVCPPNHLIMRNVQPVNHLPKADLVASPLKQEETSIALSNERLNDKREDNINFRNATTPASSVRLQTALSTMSNEVDHGSDRDDNDYRSHSLSFNQRAKQERAILNKEFGQASGQKKLLENKIKRSKKRG